MYSGHDTVIAPVLASLGVYEGSLCAWPPYASRIVFELWHARETAAGADLASPREMKLQGRQFGWKPDLLGPSIVSLSGFPQQPSQREVLSYLKSFVRVVFNGMDITQQIPACRAERKEASLGATDGTEEQPLGSVGTLRMTYVKDVINSKLSLCSLEGLIRQVRSNLGPHDTVAHACDMHQQ